MAQKNPQKAGQNLPETFLMVPTKPLIKNKLFFLIILRKYDATFCF